jgi:hypothetical protein
MPGIPLKIHSQLARLVAWALHTEGSSRSSALIRIGLVLLIWARWADEMTFFGQSSSVGILVGLNFFLATTLMLLGWHSRLAATWTATTLFGMYYYGGFVLGIEPWTHHHTYLLAMATLLVACTPSGASYSLDRWIAVRSAERNRTPPPPESGNIWGLRLMGLQLSLMYFWAAVDKTTVAFLSGERLEAIFMFFYTGSYPQWPGFHALMVFLSITTVLLEYALAFGLAFERSRRFLLIPGIAFHAILYVLLPVATFSATVCLLYLAYLRTDTVHAIIDKLQGKERAVA